MRRLLRKLQNRARLSRRDAVISLTCGLVWAGLTAARPWVIEPKCDPAYHAKSQSPCQADTILLSIDRETHHIKDLDADRLSNLTQGLAGAYPLFIAGTLSVSSALAQATPWGRALSALGTEAGLLLQSALVNGALMESTRLVVQRPRPYVYQAPADYGPEPSSYTSFYSGHTSFAALAVTLGSITLFTQVRRRRLQVIGLIFGLLLLLSTGLLRVLAGRHFTTDVLAGGFVGVSVALLISLLHRRVPGDASTSKHSLDPPVDHTQR